MNSISIFNNIFRGAIAPSLTAPSKILLQQTRNTFILKRRYPVPLTKKGDKPFMKRRHYVYDLVENTDVRKKKPLKIILTQYIDGIGKVGDIIELSPLKAYNQYLLPGLAVYPTPKNIEKYVEARKHENADEAAMSHFTNKTVKHLSTFLLTVAMSADNPWTLEKWHIRSGFRKAGVYLNDDCITMPERPISGPNFDYENKEFYVTVTINKSIDVKVRCKIHHRSNDPNASIPIVSNFYSTLSGPIYPEDKPVLDSMPIPYKIEVAIKRIEAQKEAQ